MYACEENYGVNARAEEGHVGVCCEVFDDGAICDGSGWGVWVVRWDAGAHEEERYRRAGYVYGETDDTGGEGDLVEGVDEEVVW